MIDHSVPEHNRAKMKPEVGGQQVRKRWVIKTGRRGW
jgi:hypothetical protein